MLSTTVMSVKRIENERYCFVLHLKVTLANLSMCLEKVKRRVGRLSRTRLKSESLISNRFFAGLEKRYTISHIPFSQNASDHQPSAEEAAQLPQNINLEIPKEKPQTRSEEVRELFRQNMHLLAK